MDVKSTLQWASPYSLSLVLGLAALVVVVFVMLRWAAGSPIAPARHLGLLVLRTLILGVLALILLNPIRVDETPGAVERPKVVYLVDTSQSMNLGKAATRWQQVQTTILDAEHSTNPPLSGPQVSALPVRQPARGDRWGVLASRIAERRTRRLRGKTAQRSLINRARPRANRFRHPPDRFVGRPGGPFRAGPSPGRRRFFRRPGPRPGPGGGDRARVWANEGADPCRPRRRCRCRRRCRDREHDAVAPAAGAQTLAGGRSDLRALRLQGETGWS